MVRTRIAPSPTGIPHIGNTRTALFCYLFAKHNEGEFLVRIEDTDRARFVKEAEDAILEILDWLGLSPDREISVQSKRLEVYKKHAEILKQKDLVYEDEGAIRFKMPKTGETSWTDAIGDKKITFENKTQEDFVILKSDGYPTYNFANVIDDHLMGITHVIRGAEFISSTPKHIALYKSFGWEIPVFAHMPVILGSDKQKLSKRHGAKSALDYKKEGYLKNALLNYMALLGWNPGGDREFLTMSEMINLFDFKDVNLSNPIFDPVKLNWMNQQHIQQASDEELKNLIKNFSKNSTKLSDETLTQLIPLLKSRMETLVDFEKLCGVFFDNFGEVAFDEREKQTAVNLRSGFLGIKEWKRDMIFSEIKEVMDSEKLRMPTFYKLLTGSERGLPLPEVLEILGKDKSISRLDDVVKR